MELDVGFSALEMMLATLEYHRVCARWVPWMLTQELNDHRMQVCQDLLNHYEAESDSFLDRIIITNDETWCQHYKPESKQQSMKW
jgi:histone-lysine N-methyltransferase SETMAR